MEDFPSLFNLGLCQRCTGRIFAGRGKELSNEERGRMLHFVYSIFYEDKFSFAPSDNCPLCQGILDNFDLYFRIAEEELKLYQYNTFLIGSVFDESILESENEFQEKYGNVGESIKKEFNREFGKYFSEKTGKDVDFDDPDIMIVVNTKYDFVSLQIKSLYISGKYRKYRRDLPQTRWIHKLNNDESVEYYIGRPLNDLAGGKNFHLHAAGREDVDVRMLGNGREFVIESVEPCKREISLGELEKSINSSDSGIEVFDLEFSDKKYVKELKLSSNDKTYSVLVEGDNRLEKERLSRALEHLAGKDIYQRTPLRVAGRRSDLVRERKVIDASLEDININQARIIVTAQAGTYIKELVHGDEGRTVPSISSEYGEPLRVAELDVIKIHRGNEQ
jgi:tRNA pseudouridine synthase 10